MGSSQPISPGGNSESKKIALLTPLISCLACLSTDCGPDPAAVRAELARLNSQITEAYAAGRSDSLAQLYAPDAMIFIANRPPVAGREAIAAHFERMLGGGDWEVVLTPETIVVGGSVAAERGRYTIDLTLEGSQNSVNDQGHYLVLWRLIDGQWKIQYDLATSEKRRHTSTG